MSEHLCRNCGDPHTEVKQTFCGMCREMGCGITERGNYEDRHPKDYITNPNHGGKITCHKCSGFIIEGEEIGYLDHQHARDFPAYHFHKKCYNEYEHYYGIDRPLD